MFNANLHSDAKNIFLLQIYVRNKVYESAVLNSTYFLYAIYFVPYLFRSARFAFGIAQFLLRWRYGICFSFLKE